MVLKGFIPIHFAIRKKEDNGPEQTSEGISPIDNTNIRYKHHQQCDKGNLMGS